MSTALSPSTVLHQLRFETSWPSPSTARVTVAGEVDLATADLLHDRLLGVLREHRPAVLTVGLAGVTFLDCAGINALVAVRNAALGAGHQVLITQPQPIVRHVLEVAGLLGVFTAGPRVDHHPGPSSPRPPSPR